MRSRRLVRKPNASILSALWRLFVLAVSIALESSEVEARVAFMDRRLWFTDVIVRDNMIDGQISSVVSLMADQLQNVTFRIFEEHRAGVECGEIGKG